MANDRKSKLSLCWEWLRDLQIILLIINGICIGFSLAGLYNALFPLVNDVPGVIWHLKELFIGILVTIAWKTRKHHLFLPYLILRAIVAVVLIPGWVVLYFLGFFSTQLWLDYCNSLALEPDGKPLRFLEPRIFCETHTTSSIVGSAIYTLCLPILYYCVFKVYHRFKSANERLQQYQVPQLTETKPESNQSNLV